MENRETGRHEDHNRDGRLLYYSVDSLECDKKVTSPHESEAYFQDSSLTWNFNDIFRETFKDKFGDSRLSWAGDILEQGNFETHFEGQSNGPTKPPLENCDFEMDSEVRNKSNGDDEFDFFKSLTEEELECFGEVFLEVAKEEEYKMRKTNAKLSRELFYFRNEVNRSVYECNTKFQSENNFTFDCSDDLRTNDIMFDDNIHIYDALLQKRQPILHQHINNATQPEQLSRILQDLKGIKESIDVARSLVTLKFLDSNCLLNDRDLVDQKKSETTNSQGGRESRLLFFGDEQIKRPKYTSVFDSQKVEEVEERTNASSPVDNIYNRLNNLGIRISSESWMTVDTVDLNSENDKIDSTPDETSRGSWTPDCSIDHNNEMTKQSSSTEIESKIDKDIEHSSNKLDPESDQATNVASTECEEHLTNKEILKSLVRELFQRFLQSPYFKNPGFVESIDDAVDVEQQPNIFLHLNSQDLNNIDEDSTKSVQFKANQAVVRPDNFDFTGNAPSCQTIVQRRSDKQPRPVQVLRPIRLQQRSIPHYSSLWFSSIARLSLENFLKTSSIPIVQTLPKISNLPQKLKIKPKNAGSQIKTNAKVSQTSQIETITSIQNASKINLLRTNEANSAPKPTMVSNLPPSSRGAALEKYCSKPCRFLLVKQITNLHDPTSDTSAPLLSSTSSLKWIIKWLRKPLKFNQPVLPTRSIKPTPLDQTRSQDELKEARVKPNRNSMQFRMVEVEIRDLTQEQNATADKTPATIMTTNAKQSAIIKPINNPTNMFSLPLGQAANLVTNPSSHNAYHPPRTGKIPFKQQKRRHVFRNI